MDLYHNSSQGCSTLTEKISYSYLCGIVDEVFVHVSVIEPGVSDGIPDLLMRIMISNKYYILKPFLKGKILQSES